MKKVVINYSNFFYLNFLIKIHVFEKHITIVNMINSISSISHLVTATPRLLGGPIARLV